MATLRNRIAYTIRQKLNKALFSLKVRHFPTQRYLFDQTYTVWYTEELWRELGARSGADFAFVNHVNDKFVSLIKSEAPLSRHSPGINTVLTLITNEIQYWRIFLRSRRINIRQYYLWWKKNFLNKKQYILKFHLMLDDWCSMNVEATVYLDFSKDMHSEYLAQVTVRNLSWHLVYTQNGNFLLSSLGTSLSIKNKLKSLHKILLSELIQLVTYRFFGRKMSFIIIPSSFINYNL